MSSEISQLIEQVLPRLIEDNSRIIVRDGGGQIIDEREVPIDLIALFGPYDQGFLPPGIHVGLAEFYELVSDVIDYAQERASIITNQRVKFVKEYPDDPMALLSNGKEIITVRVISRKPGSNKPSGHGRPQRAGTFSYNLKLPQFPNKVLTVESRPVDHNIEFSCWAKTAGLADRRAIWLEKLLIAQRWAFQVKGVERLLWTGRGVDEIQKHGEQKLHVRRLTFHLRISELEVNADQIVQSIFPEVRVNPLGG